VVDPLLNARLHANSPLVLLPQYIPAMKALEAISVEVGDKDFLLRDDTWMHEELDRFGVAHEWRCSRATTAIACTTASQRAAAVLRCASRQVREPDMKALIATALLALVAAPAAAQNITAAPPPIPEGDHGRGDQGPRRVAGRQPRGQRRRAAGDVVLPPSYKTNPSKRYPVVYYLHGFAIDGKNFYNYMHVPEAVAHNAAAGREFIVVVPSTLTRMGGSMYSSSVTTGDFRKFIAEDLVQYIDSHLPHDRHARRSRLAGHSMGGYGTWTIGMSYPQVFDSIWAQSACCVSPRTETVESATAMSAVRSRASTSRASACARGSPR
jgi:hypothetical protein